MQELAWVCLYKFYQMLYRMQMPFNPDNPQDLGLLMGPELLIVPDVVRVGVPLDGTT